ncbi:hypothetical protein THAOC_11574 [Thalassiosira oceanica]|uniref:Uncharacterized protein n=1 Tax=Thalassiosira oceanica TaxID=159749 RepID=K0TA39_THAOC|nr:hypothetical protein THAOC_11574 [Thalassiosira oceanica]|eukprot:EJK67402.1 hypothetical protein THAOC_11574 [Thalassiosira oceanica]
MEGRRGRLGDRDVRRQPPPPGGRPEPARPERRPVRGHQHRGRRELGDVREHRAHQGLAALTGRRGGRGCFRHGRRRRGNLFPSSLPFSVYLALPLLSARLFDFKKVRISRPLPDVLSGRWRNSSLASRDQIR